MPSYSTPSSSSPVTKYFDSGDGVAWTETSVSLMFGFAYKTVTAGVSITLYRKASYNPPHVKIIVYDWEESKFYWWFEADDPDKHILHLTWRQP